MITDGSEDIMVQAPQLRGEAVEWFDNLTDEHYKALAAAT